VSADAVLHARGKVRDVYEVGDRLLIVATDRISAFDAVLPTPIPDKGRVLTGLSLFWFDRTADLVGNHLVSAEPRDLPSGFDDDLPGRAMLVRRADVVPVECVARGYLSGSGWTQYAVDGRVCGVALPSGLVESDRLPEPIFTPTTKAAAGHDLPLAPEEARDLVGLGLAERLKELTLTLYERAAAIAIERGIILADTKFEFGIDADGSLVVGDEVLTPDSSRFWPADSYAPGSSPPSFDKQFVRDWLETQPWDKTPPGPELPDEVREGTAARYRDAYERLAGRPFASYLEEMGVSAA